jgi:hypothetical protein
VCKIVTESVVIPTQVPHTTNIRNKFLKIEIPLRKCFKINFLGRSQKANSATSSVADPDPGSEIRCLFDPWIRDPGSGIGLFRIPDLGSRIPNPKPIYLRAY